MLKFFPTIYVLSLPSHCLCPFDLSISARRKSNPKVDALEMQIQTQIAESFVVLSLTANNFHFSLTDAICSLASRRSIDIAGAVSPNRGWVRVHAKISIAREWRVSFGFLISDESTATVTPRRNTGLGSRIENIGKRERNDREQVEVRQGDREGLA